MRTSPIAPPVVSIKKPEERIFQVRYLQNLNLVTVKGWSITSDVHEKYGQLLVDIQRHLDLFDSLNVHFNYDLFNCSTAKYLFTIIKFLNKANKEGKEVKIYWSCCTENDREMMDTGIDLSAMCDFKFEITYC